MTRYLLSSALFLSLAACGGSESEGSSTTKLDAIEVQPGTISDAMIILDDTSLDGTAIDNSVPDEGSPKKAEKTDAAEESSGDDAAEAGDTDAVAAPAAKKAVSAPAAKTAAE